MALVKLHLYREVYASVDTTLTVNLPIDGLSSAEMEAILEDYVSELNPEDYEWRLPADPGDYSQMAEDEIHLDHYEEV